MDGGEMVPTGAGQTATPDHEGDAKRIAWEKLKALAGAVMVLEVTTVVGTVTATVNNDGGRSTIIVAPTDQVVARLTVDTGLGNTILALSKEAVADEKLMQLQAEAVKNALAIRQHTIEVLKSIIAGIASRI